MNIIGNRLMASSIEKSTDFPQEQTVEFELMFPVDFANNEYEKRCLTFHEVCFYQIEEILTPKGRSSQISIINDLGTITRKVNLNNTEVEIIRQRFEIITTCGKRTIDFSEYEFKEY